MATAATSLLGLALPVTGELSGTWGDTVNVSITALLDTAVAGTTTLSSDSDVTLTTTTLAANQARQAIILWTAGGTVTRTITVPAQSKSYIVINKTSSSQSIKIVGVGPTTGVTIVAGTAAFVVWNGVDFVTASVTSTTGVLPVANGGTGLSSGTSGGVLAYTATGTLASSAALAASALVIGGGAGAAPSTTTTGTGVVTALGVNTGTAGAFVVNGGALGTPSSGTVTNLTGTASININGTVGATTPTTGAFTTLSASGATTIGARLQVTAAGSPPASGSGLEVLGGATPLLFAYNRTGSAYLPLNFDASAHGFSVAGASIATVSSTGLAITGTLSATGAVTLSGGTANGVAYLDASKVLTTGSALTYNGTALTSSASSAISGIFNRDTSSGATLQIQVVGNSVGTLGSDTGGNGRFDLVAATSMQLRAAGASGYISFDANNTEQMRLTSSLLSVVPGATIQGLTVGLGAGAVSTNTAVGASALGGSNTGTENTAIGQQALLTNTSGSSNTAIGRNALALNTTGGSNTASGFHALLSNTSGANNSALGVQALNSNTTASNNTAVGYQAGYNNTTGAQNTALGWLTLVANTTGSDITAVGAYALGKNTTGGSNVAVGRQALQENTTASNNTAVGYQAGYTNQAVENQTFVGYQAGFSRNSVADNYSTVMVGNLAGYSTSSGIDNTYIGGYAARFQTGSSNTALGGGALYGASGTSTGSNNTAVGYGSLLSSTTASNNTAVGVQAGYSNLTGTYNTYVGTQAGYIAKGDRNAVFGFQAGYNLTTAIGNTLIGSNAGELVTTGSNNTFVGGTSSGGGFSGSVMTTGSRNTIIGAYSGNQGGLDIRTANNYIVLSDGEGNPQGIFDNQGTFLVAQTAKSQIVVGAHMEGGGSLNPGTVSSVLAASTSAASSYNLYSTGAGAFRFYVNMAGTINATSIVITAISDQRLKENIRDIDTGLGAIMALKPRRFDWKEGKGQDKKNAAGFIAQEFEEVFPECVSTSKAGGDGIEYKNINHETLIPTLVKAIQELKAEFDAYKASHP
jgi:hypothetical protein